MWSAREDNRSVMKCADCGLCGGKDTKIIEVAEKPYEVVKCKNCGLVYVTPQPDEGDVSEHYDESYYKEWITKQAERRNLMWKLRIKGLQRYKKTGKLLDIGCGVGTFLMLAKNEGFEVYGTEISKYASQLVNKKMGEVVFNGTLEQASFPDKYFDIITLWHVVEHLPNPSDILREANRILKDRGVIVIAVPNLNAWLMKIVYLFVRRKRLKLFSKDEKELHLYFFTPYTIRRLLELTGFKMIKIGMDTSAIGYGKRLLDNIAGIFYLVTKINIGLGIKVYATKEARLVNEKSI